MLARFDGRSRRWESGVNPERPRRCNRALDGTPRLQAIPVARFTCSSRGEGRGGPEPGSQKTDRRPQDF